MRVVIQRVTKASVSINDKVKSEISQGLLILLGIESADSEQDIDWLVNKIVNLRIFDDKDGRMNLSVNDIDGDILVISQFTLHASIKKGKRPSYLRAAHPDISIPLYNKFVDKLSEGLNESVFTGEFGAMMQVSLVNDGPVTIIIDSKKKE